MRAIRIFAWFSFVDRFFWRRNKATLATPLAQLSRLPRAQRLDALKKRRKAHFWGKVQNLGNWERGVNWLNFAVLVSFVFGVVFLFHDFSPAKSPAPSLTSSDSPYPLFLAMVAFILICLFQAGAHMFTAWSQVRKWTKPIGTGQAWTSAEAVEWRARDKEMAQDADRVAHALELEEAVFGSCVPDSREKGSRDAAKTINTTPGSQFSNPISVQDSSAALKARARRARRL